MRLMHKCDYARVEWSTTEFIEVSTSQGQASTSYRQVVDIVQHALEHEVERQHAARVLHHEC